MRTEFEYTMLVVDGVGVPMDTMNELGEDGWEYIDSHNLPGGERGFLFKRTRTGTDAADVHVTEMPTMEFTVTEEGLVEAVSEETVIEPANSPTAKAKKKLVKDAPVDV